MSTPSVPLPATAARTRWARLPWTVGAGVLLAGATGALIVVLLVRFPYDGLYGQDSYAYYFQARALWHDMSGAPLPPNPLFDSQGFRWPVGYYWHLIAGFVIGGLSPAGGRALTLLLMALAPALVYALIGALWREAPRPARLGAGLIGGGAMVLTGTYARFGLSLMADVPAVFWSVLGLVCVLHAWPPDAAAPVAPATARRWALAAGLALGIAVLVRYAAVLLVGPLAVYTLLRWAQQRRWVGPSPAWTVPGLVVGLLPQGLYYLTHASGSGYSAFLGDWHLDNLFKSTLSGSDGTTSFLHSQVVFYLIEPLAQVSAGFLSPFLLPAWLLGLGVLVAGRRWAVIGLLLSWWIGLALFFSGTPYQAHRFVLDFLPALVTLIGIGGATALGWIVGRWRAPRSRAGWGRVAAGALVVLGLVVGAWQDQRSVRDWVATQATFQAQEQAVATAARQAAAAAGLPGPAHAICFSVSAALYYYTQWPVIDLFNYDEAGLAHFLAQPGPAVIVVPEANLASQWAGTPSLARWQWLQAHYLLQRQGQAGEFTVYTVGGPRS